MTEPDHPSGAFMRSEIDEQPKRWLDVVELHSDRIETAAQLIRDSAPQLIVFAGRGSSDHAAMYGQYLAHNLLGTPAMLATPSTVTAFGTDLHYPKAVMLAVSQSGDSPDLLDTVRSAIRAGVPVVAFTNNDASSLAGLADVHVPLAAGPELSVAATKTYTAELLALYLVLSRSSGRDWAALEDETAAASRAARMTLDENAEAVTVVAKSLVDADRVLVVGRGYAMSTAKEGALKLMETNAMAASGWSAADATHGPLAQVVRGTPVIAITASPKGRSSVESFSQAASDLGGRIVAVGPTPQLTQGAADSVAPQAALLGHCPGLVPELLPLIEIIPLQQLALELALLRGLNPDQPAGLKKVTKTT